MFSCLNVEVRPWVWTDLIGIPLSLYVHFPWCVKKCPYCDFNSHAALTTLPERAYVDALIQDFEQQLASLGERTIDSVFIGGGTPSLIAPTEIKRLLTAIRQSERLADRAEITIEANPGALDAGHFDAYLDGGVNRLSIGVQSFNDGLLKKIGRIHSSEEARMAVERAHQAGFKRINIDLMFGLPEQSLEASRLDIERAIELADQYGVSHLSVYQLTIEPNTQFAVTPPPLPDTDMTWAMQEQAQALLRKAGFEQYEVSAYSRNQPCQHNLNYWQFGDYVAIGAGAHGKLSDFNLDDELQIQRYWNHRHPKAYLDAAQASTFMAETKKTLTKDRDFEFLMNALRLKSGFDLSLYAQRTGADEGALLQVLSDFFKQDYLRQSKGRIAPTDKGYRYLDTVLLAVLPDHASGA